LSGATKLSRYFANILTRDNGMADHRTDSEIAPVYEEKLARYDAEAAK